MTTPRTLGERLRARDPLLLNLAIVPSPITVELIGLAGFDGVIFDMEHGPFTLGSVAECIAAAERRGLVTAVRIPFGKRSDIGPLLDLGIAGIVVPHVSTADMAAEIAQECRFRPVGERGANPWVRAAGFAGAGDYFARENDRVGVIVQIEGREGLQNAEAIIRTPGVDGVFVGPVDLSHALGVPDELEHPLISDAVETIRAIAHDAGVSVCVFCATAAQVGSWQQRGVDTAIFGVDANLMLAGLRSQVDAARDRSAAERAR